MAFDTDLSVNYPKPFHLVCLVIGKSYALRKFSYIIYKVFINFLNFEAP